MKKVKRNKKQAPKVSIDEIEKLALDGKDVNDHFSDGKIMPPISSEVQRVNVDFGVATLLELDQIAIELNVSRQAVIKLFIKKELDQHFIAKKARKEA
jgi:hypothetical protein